MSWHDVLDKVVLWGGVLLFTIVVLYITQKRALGLTPGFVKQQATRMFWFTLSSISRLPSQLGSLASQNPASESVETPSHRTERPIASSDEVTFESSPEPDAERGTDAIEQQDGMDTSMDALQSEEENAATDGASHEEQPEPRKFAPHPDDREQAESAWEDTGSVTMEDTEDAAGAEGVGETETDNPAVEDVTGIDDGDLTRGSTPENDDSNSDVQHVDNGAAHQQNTSDDRDGTESEVGWEDTETVSVYEDDRGSTPTVDIVGAGRPDPDDGAAPQGDNDNDDSQTQFGASLEETETDTASLHEDDALEGGHVIGHGQDNVDHALPVEEKAVRGGRDGASLKEAESGPASDAVSQTPVADAGKESPPLAAMTQRADVDEADGASWTEDGRRDDRVEVPSQGVHDAMEPSMPARDQEEILEDITMAVGEDDVNTEPIGDGEGRKHDEL